MTKPKEAATIKKELPKKTPKAAVAKAVPAADAKPEEDADAKETPETDAVKNEEVAATAETKNEDAAAEETAETQATETETETEEAETTEEVQDNAKSENHQENDITVNDEVEVKPGTEKYKVIRQFKDAKKYLAEKQTAKVWKVGADVSHFPSQRLNDLLAVKFIEKTE